MSGSNLIVDGLKVGESNPLPIGALSRIDSNNTTTTPLAGAATYTGTWTEVLDFVELLVRCEADVAGTLYFETSNDGVNLSGTAVQVNAGTGSATFALPQFALTGPFRHDLQVYLGPFPAKTDLYVVGVGPTGGSAMSAEFAVVLIDA